MSIIPGLPPMDTPTIKPIVQLLCLWVRYIISSTDEVEKKLSYNFEQVSNLIRSHDVGRPRPYVHAADGRHSGADVFTCVILCFGLFEAALAKRHADNRAKRR